MSRDLPVQIPHPDMEVGSQESVSKWVCECDHRPNKQQDQHEHQFMRLCPEPFLQCSPSPLVKLWRKHQLGRSPRAVFIPQLIVGSSTSPRPGLDCTAHHKDLCSSTVEVGQAVQTMLMKPVVCNGDAQAGAAAARPISTPFPKETHVNRAQQANRAANATTQQSCVKVGCVRHLQGFCRNVPGHLAAGWLMGTSG